MVNEHPCETLSFTTKLSNLLKQLIFAVNYFVVVVVVLGTVLQKLTFSDILLSIG